MKRISFFILCLLSFVLAQNTKKNTIQLKPIQSDTDSVFIISATKDLYYIRVKTNSKPILDSIPKKSTQVFENFSGINLSLSKTPTFIYGVYVNGIYQTEGINQDYTVSGNQLLFSYSWLNDRIVIIYE